ncbi:MAG: CBS domain-containing protein [Pirellulales bacterium]
MQVREIMSDDLKCCTPELNLKQAAEMMIACDCGAVPVVDRDDHRRPLGMLTDRDIVCRAVAMGKSPLDTKVGQCMTSRVTTVPIDATVEECCRLMERAQIRRVLVEDERGLLCGIISQADIARRLPEELAGEVVHMISEPSEHSSAAV